MAWTDEIVEQLKQHWTDGKSASQIAGLLGNGLTRNAIIGKVHRLGLAGRAKTPGANVPRPRRLPPPPAHRMAGPQRLASAAPRMMRGATALAIAPQALAEVEEEAGVRERGRADVAQGDHPRAQGGDVPLAARRPVQRRIPLLRFTQDVGAVLRLPWRSRLPAGAGAPPRPRPLPASPGALTGFRGWLRGEATKPRHLTRAKLCRSTPLQRWVASPSGPGVLVRPCTPRT